MGSGKSTIYNAIIDQWTEVPVTLFVLAVSLTPVRFNEHRYVLRLADGLKCIDACTTFECSEMIFGMALEAGDSVVVKRVSPTYISY